MAQVEDSSARASHTSKETRESAKMLLFSTDRSLKEEVNVCCRLVGGVAIE